jgi:nucleoside-diphosphate-sugar epimerase/SAM-dependent methyltransferase
MKNIVITGGLGYIGCELCKIYSGESRVNKITVIDNRFVSERVSQLRNWGIDYVQASILDEKALEPHLSKADVIIHLAGITDVAYVKTQSNEEHDKQIICVGVEGTRNVIKYSNPNAKIIFPSTHVVYEGFSETKTDISECIPPCPVLTYAKVKVQNEEDLFEANRNFVILRLASVYGYSTDTMRMGIMPNLFSKITSMNGTISLFSGGVQLKSLVSVYDVARCMKFMEERSDISRKLFHLSNESTTIKEVANLCKEINPNVTIVETKDEIPNLGYTISNENLLKTGFTFRYSLKKCLEEMIHHWSKKDINPSLEYMDKGGKEYVDNRGIIRNYELTEPINLIGYIESKAETVRANHYHPIQEQKCLLVKGQYISVTKDLLTENAPVETRLVNEGDIAIIKPNVAHTMVFTEDSIFLNLVRGEREHENYGITHTIPYILVDESMRKQLLETYKKSCRSCGNKHLEDVVSLGLSPLANSLKNEKQEKEELFPLEMKYCPSCHNCQLSVVVPPEKMFDNYLYVSSTSQTFRKHFEDAADSYVSRFNLTNESFVVDIGSNDGIALKPFQKKGIKVLGIEPAKNIAKLANESGVLTYNRYFDSNVADSVTHEFGWADIVTASNVFAHSDKLKDIAHAAFRLLKENGTFIIEVQYLLDTMKDLTFDNIYHEHTNYWSVLSLKNFFRSCGYFVNDVEHINTHGGSIRVYVSRSSTESKNVAAFIQTEREYGLDSIRAYRSFGERVYKLRETVRKNMEEQKKIFRTIAAYGSPAKATTGLNFFGITDKDIVYTIEDNALKNGKYIPGVNIPIKDRSIANTIKPDLIVVLAWNFYEDIKKNNKELSDKGTKFLSIKDLYT